MPIPKTPPDVSVGVEKTRRRTQVGISGASTPAYDSQALVGLRNAAAVALPAVQDARRSADPAVREEVAGLALLATAHLGDTVAANG